MLNFLTLAQCNKHDFFILMFLLVCFSYPSHAQTPELSPQPEPQPETPATTQPKPISLSGNRNVKLQSVSVSGNLTRFLSDQYNTPGFTVQQQGSVTLQGQVGEDTQIKATLSDQGPVLPGQSQNISVSLDSKYFGAAFGETSLSFENAELALPNKRLSGLYGYVQLPGEKGEPAKFKTQILTAKSKGIPQQDTFTSDKAKLSYQLTRRPVLVGSERPSFSMACERKKERK